ncbi:hypothetical protein U9M48_001431, partial [Paspalum notatum var. saurae]
MTRYVGISFNRPYGGNVAVKVNGQNGPYFQTRKGLRQGDPLSPIPFNIVADRLAIIINRAKEVGKVNGVIPHLVEDGLSILQYADDTVLFMDHDLEKARNMKVLLCIFEKLSGLKINFHKSEIVCFGQAKEFENIYSELFGCRVGSLPFRHIEERFEKRLSGWKGKLLSVGGRLQNDQHKKKYHFIKWDQVRQPKQQGGLGIIDLEVQNKCLLSKWLFKLANEDGIWQRLLRNKYLKSKPFGSGSKKPGISHFWAGLMEVKHLFLGLGSFLVGNDTWCGSQPLKFIYPSLFNIVRNKSATVADVMSSVPLNVFFRRGLVGERLRAWHELVGMVMRVPMRGGRDVFKWSLNKTVSNGIKVSQEIWKTKIPLKIKIFIWYVKRGVLLTKDNLARRNWNGHQGCCFCNKRESIQHLFFDCQVAKFIWR